MKPWSRILFALAATACSSADETQVCQDAADHVAACFGQDTMHSTTCDAEQASRILDTSCDELASQGKADRDAADVLCFVFGYCPEIPAPDCSASQPVELFDGKTLAGWHRSTDSFHGSGDGWRAEDGALVGGQDRFREGGVLLTNACYKHFELTVELSPDSGVDSGIYLRSNERGQAYQIRVDNAVARNIGGVFGEGIGGGSLQAAEGWEKVWKQDAWNQLRVRIVGNPPRIRTWLNGAPMVDFTDDKRRTHDTGMIGFQVHWGWLLWKRDGLTRYRNLEIKPLEPPQPDREVEPLAGTRSKAAGWEFSTRTKR